MAKSVKKTIGKKPAAKPAAKKTTAKPVAKKSAKPVAKPAAKKTVAKSKPVAKKTVSKPVVKKTAAKTPAKKIVAKPAAKKTTAKSVAKPVAKKAAAKPAVKKTVAKAPAKKVVAKATAKKTVSKPVVKKTVKPSVKSVAPKTAPKKTIKPAKTAAPKVVQKKTKEEEHFSKIAQRKRKIQEIKNNYETPIQRAQDEDYGDYQPPIIGRTRFSDAELNEFKTLINKKIKEAREELDFYQEAMKESEMNDDDIKFSGMEDGGHTNDKEHLSAMANRQIKFIQNLESAIMRIENKTYGICRKTGNLIDKKRLMAVPHATLSMEAKTGKIR